jgi:hypothetical protein
LTFDYGAFEDALRALDDRAIVVPGTDIGRALDEAFHAMEKIDRRKVVVLLTDGEDLEKSGVTVAESLADKGVVAFTVGVGTEAGAEIQVMNEQGQPELVRDTKGETVRSRLDETTLRKIAQATKGNYYPLGPLGEGLAKVRLAMERTVLPPARGGASWRGPVLPIAVVLGLLVVESLMVRDDGKRTMNSENKMVRNCGTTVQVDLVPQPEVLIAGLHRGIASVSTLISCAIQTRRARVPSLTPEPPPPTTPREFFNAGSQKLRRKVAEG